MSTEKRKPMKVEFFRHNITKDDIASAARTLESLFLTTGPVTKRFESAFSRYIHVPEVVGVTSCTAALYLSLVALGIRPGDEVITTPMTFIATSNSILHAGAKPIFVDVEPDTGLLSIDLLKKAITPRTKAIVPVHLYGQMCDMKAIRSIADQYKLFVIEDAAHCVEGSREGLRPGQLGDTACFSFYATKNITSGEGGAIATCRPDLAETLKKLRSHGMTKSAADRYHGSYQHWDMDILGYKFNMFDIQSALLLPQLKRLDANWRRREAIAQRYEKAFSSVREICFPRTLAECRHAHHLFTIWVDPQHRDKILHRLQEVQVGVAVNYRAVHLLSYYKKTFGFRAGDFPVAENIGSRTITLPLYPQLTDEEVDYVIEKVVKCVREGSD